MEKSLAFGETNQLTKKGCKKQRSPIQPSNTWVVGTRLNEIMMTVVRVQQLEWCVSVGTGFQQA